MPDSAWLADALATPMWEWASLAVGLVVGSFANVCIHRLPRSLSVVTPASRCPACGARVRALDNLPVLSWVVLLGRCRACGGRISLRYPAVELANGLLYTAVAFSFGPTLHALVVMALVTALLVLGLIDLEHQILPDRITLPGIAVGFAASFLPASPVGPVESAAAAGGGYLAFFAVAETYRRVRGVEGLGQGDWKMAAMLGAFLGWQQLLLTIFLASLAGSLVGAVFLVARGRLGWQHALPLGTFLSLAGLGVVFVGDPVIVWYRGFWNG